MKRAFTLIELLVVIAIIAILAAILFPVFAQAKSAAKTSSCLANSKQLSLGLTLYASDYDDKLPAATEHDSGGGGGELEGESWLDSIQPYLKAKLLYKCPSDTSTHWSDATDARQTSYGLNAYVTFNHAPYFGPALSSFTQPSETILAAELNDQVTEDHFMPMFWGDPAKLEDVDKQAEQWDPIKGQPLALVLTRHAIGSNYPFADGHSKHMKFGQIWHQTTGSVADKDWFDPLR